MITRAQRIALDTYLTDYPENKTFEQILCMIQVDNEDIIICEAYENMYFSTLIDHIKTLENATQMLAYDYESEAIYDALHNATDGSSVMGGFAMLCSHKLEIIRDFAIEILAQRESEIDDVSEVQP